MGRPTRAAAAALADQVVETAITLFLRDGYAATSMEGVAKAAGVSKRTLYKHHPGKAALLGAAISALVVAWRPPFDAEDVNPDDLSGSLLRLARAMLAVALTPAALALHRLAVAEAARFPEIMQALHRAGTASGVDRIASLLDPVAPLQARWAAEQFQRLVVSGPQQRALGFGPPLDEAERDVWARQSVALFLGGIAPAAPDVHNGIVSRMLGSAGASCAAQREGTGMADKKGEDDKPPPTVDDIMSTGEMKPILAQARRGQEVSCAVGLSKEKEGVILLDKRMSPKKLRDQLRKEADKIGLELEDSSLRYGKASVDSEDDPKLLMLAINKQGAGVLEQKLRERLKAVGFKEVEITIGGKEGA